MYISNLFEQSIIYYINTFWRIVILITVLDLKSIFTLHFILKCATYKCVQEDDLNCPLKLSTVKANDDTGVKLEGVSTTIFYPL